MLERGGLRARLAQGAEDAARIAGLRAGAFPPAPGLSAASLRVAKDAEARVDASALQILVEAGAGAGEARALAAFRLRILQDQADLDDSYVSGFFDVSALRAMGGPWAEMGRFCLGPDLTLGLAADVLRLSWVMVTRLVEAAEARALIGCVSLKGADPARHAPGLSWLAAHHPAPEAMSPRPRPGHAAHALTADEAGDPRGLPPILRSYLGLGGWVAGHVVEDPILDTLVLPVVVEIARIPPGRAARLRALAG